MKRKKTSAGFTLVEVMIAMFLVSIAAIIVYTEILLAYRILMRSRARLEAQSIAFDSLWRIYNAPLAEMPDGLSTNVLFYPGQNPPMSCFRTNRTVVWPTPAGSSMSTNGTISCGILAETNTPVLPDPVWYWDIVVTVWPPTNTMLEIGTNPLSRYAVRRYRGER